MYLTIHTLVDMRMIDRQVGWIWRCSRCS